MYHRIKTLLIVLFATSVLSVQITSADTYIDLGSRQYGADTGGCGGLHITAFQSYTATSNSVKLSIGINCGDPYNYYLQGYSYLISSGTTINSQSINVNASNNPVKTTVSGLVPNKAYIWTVHVNYAGPERGTTGPEASLVVYTEPALPIGLAFPSVLQNSVSITWNNSGNDAGTSYTLQRKTDTAPWQDVATGVNMSSYTDSGLTPNTKYYYRIKVNALIGTAFYSNEAWIVTAQDPAVAAAKAAQSAAETSKLASEQAKSSADIAAANSIYNGQSAAYWAYQAMQQASVPQPIRVMSGTDFGEVIVGEISGQSDGVKAQADSGYTILSGKLTISDSTKKIEIRKVVIGSKTLFFKIIAPPSSGATAKVSFS